jgi:hypothetical protein
LSDGLLFDRLLLDGLLHRTILGRAVCGRIDIVYGRSGLDGGGVTVSQDRLVQMFIGIHDHNLQSEIFSSVFGKIYIQHIL